MPTTKDAHPRRKTRYHIRNWATYDRALVRRGSLTVWLADEALGTWRYSGPVRRGAQPDYSDRAIETMITIREVFGLTNRTTEGFVSSLFGLLKIDLPVPDHTTLSRRGQSVALHLPKRASGNLHLVLDSSGLKVYGEGEWKVRQHGWSKRRTWRKIHLAVEATTGEVQAAMLSTAGVADAEMVDSLLAQIDQPLASVTADGSYDKRLVYQILRTQAPKAKVLIPPRRDARIWQHGNTQARPLGRDQILRYIRVHGRSAWKKHSGYHRRSLAETSVFRFKTIFGGHLTARRLDTQASQFGGRCRALNLMTHLGMPDSYKVA